MILLIVNKKGLIRIRLKLNLLMLYGHDLLSNSDFFLSYKMSGVASILFQFYFQTEIDFINIFGGVDGGKIEDE